MYENLTENDKQILLDTYNMWCHLAKYGCMLKSDYPLYGREIIFLNSACGYCHIFRECLICPLSEKSTKFAYPCCCSGFYAHWRCAETSEEKSFYATKIRDVQAEFLRKIGVLPAVNQEEGEI